MMAAMLEHNILEISKGKDNVAHLKLFVILCLQKCLQGSHKYISFERTHFLTFSANVVNAKFG